MKYFLFPILLMCSLPLIAQTPCSGGMAGAYPCSGYNLQAHLDLNALNAGSGNDSWGWTDPVTGKEYAIMALNNGTAFIDITNPTSPIYLGKLPTHTSNSSWRDVKTYNNHAFVVSEVTSDGLQVFDLTRLRGLSTSPTGGASRVFSEDAFLYRRFG